MTDYGFKPVETTDYGFKPVESQSFSTDISGKPDPNWIGPLPMLPLEQIDGGADYLELSRAVREKPKTGFFENIVPGAKDIPFAGDLIDAAKVAKVAHTVRMLNAGERPTDKDILDLNYYMKRQERDQQKTFMGKVGDVLRESVVFGLEFGGTLAAAKKIGLSAGASGARKYIEKNLTAAAGKYVSAATASKVAKVGTVMAELNSLAVLQDVMRPGATIKGYNERVLGQMLSGKDPDALGAFITSVMDMHIEHFSEMTGQHLGAGVNKLVGKFTPAPLRAAVRAKIKKSAVAGAIMNTFGTPAGKVGSVLEKFGYHGVVEEIYEERLGGFMRGLFGVDTKAGLVSAMREAVPSPEQLGIEAVAFSIPMLAIHGSRTFRDTSVSYNDAVRNSNLMTANTPDTAVRTRQDLARDITQIYDLRDKERQSPWYMAKESTQWMGRMKWFGFGKARANTLKDVATRRYAISLDGAIDAAEKSAPKGEERAAGIQAVHDFLRDVVGVQVTETEAERDELRDAMREGKVYRESYENKLTNKIIASQIFGSGKAVTKEEMHKLSRLGIQFIRDIDDVDLEALGEPIDVDAIRSGRQEDGSISADALDAVKSLFTTRSDEDTRSLFEMLERISKTKAFSTPEAKITPAGEESASDKLQQLEDSVKSFEEHLEDVKRGEKLDPEAVPLPPPPQQSQRPSNMLFSIPIIVAEGTREQIYERTGYRIPDGAEYYNNQKKTFRVLLAASNDKFGNVYLSKAATGASIAEDTVETRLKVVEGGLKLADIADEYDRKVALDLAGVRDAEMAKPKDEQNIGLLNELNALLLMGHTEKGRIERFAQFYTFKEFGWGKNAQLYGGAFETIGDMTENEVDRLTAYMESVLGEDLHEALKARAGDRVYEAPRKDQDVADREEAMRTPARTEIVRRAVETPRKGGVEQARAAMAETDITEQTQELISILRKDMRKAENREAVLDILNSMDRVGLTFSLHVFKRGDSQGKYERMVGEMTRGLDAKRKLKKEGIVSAQGDRRADVWKNIPDDKVAAEFQRNAAILAGASDVIPFQFSIPPKPRVEHLPEGARGSEQSDKEAEITERNLEKEEKPWIDRETIATEDLINFGPTWLQEFEAYRDGSSLSYLDDGMAGTWIIKWADNFSNQTNRQFVEQFLDENKEHLDIIREAAHLQPEEPMAEIAAMLEEDLDRVPSLIDAGSPLYRENSGRVSAKQAKIGEKQATFTPDDDVSAADMESTQDLMRSSPYMADLQEINLDAKPSLDNVPVSDQLEQIVVTGSGSAQYVGNIFAENMPGLELLQSIFPMTMKSVNSFYNIGSRFGGNFERHLQKLMSIFYARNTEDLNDDGIEGWVVVYDNTDRTLGPLLGYPVENFITAAQTGRFSTGPAMHFDEEGNPVRGTKKMADKVVWDNRTQDFYLPIAETDIADGAYRAVFPISARMLMSMAEQVSEKKMDVDPMKVQQMADRVAAWMARNKIRNLGIMGLDQLSSDGQEIVRASWLQPMQYVMRKLLDTNPQIRPKRGIMPGQEAEQGLEAQRPTPGAVRRVQGNVEAPREARIPEVNRDIRQVLESTENDSVQYRAVGSDNVTDSYQEALANARSNENDALRSTVEVLVNDKVLGKITDGVLHHIDTSGETFSLELPDRIMQAVRRFNNNRLLPKSEYDGFMRRIRRALKGRTVDQDWLFRNLTAADRKAFGPLFGRPGREAGEPPPAPAGPVVLEEAQMSLPFETQQARNDFTNSLQLMEPMIQALDVLMAGEEGVHRAFLNATRNANAEHTEDMLVADRWREKLGLMGMKASQLPEGHRERAELMLQGVKMRLDNPVENELIGRGEQPQISKLYADWNANKPASMPTAEEIEKAIGDKLEVRRNAANEFTKDLSDAEWLRLVENYATHEYGNLDSIEQKDIAKAVIKEQSERSLSRIFNTYREAFEASGLMPSNSNAIDLFEHWSTNVWKAARNRQFAGMAVLTVDQEGAPQVIPIRTKDNAPGVMALIDESILHKAAKNLSAYLDKPYTRMEDPQQQINDLIDSIPNMEDLGYVRMDSPHTGSVDYVWVKDGVSQNVVKMMLDKAWSNDWTRAMDRFVSWSKYMAIGFSGFHPFSLLESLIASFGMTKSNPLFRPLQAYAEMKKLLNEARMHPEKYTPWIRAGLAASWTNPDIRIGLIDKDLQTMITKVEASNLPGKKAMGRGLIAFRNFKRTWDRFLWHTMHPALKLYTAEFVLGEYRASAEAEGRDFDETLIREQIARHINNAFGGQEWESYTWATPHAKQMLHWMLFAPDWTLSAANVAGATSLPGIRNIINPALSELAYDQMFKRYWPAMAALVLYALPNALQAGIYAAAAAAGSLDPDDKLFTFQNEVGKRTHVDFTPILRMLPGYNGGVSGKRRVYMRWGKQAYEVFEGWFQDTSGTLLGKSSTLFKTAFEQATGTTVSGWDLPFKDQGLMGFLSSPDGFFGSRAGSVVETFMPMWATQIIQDRPLSFIAPVSRGASLGSTIRQMTETLEAFANQGVWSNLSHRPEYVPQIEQYVTDYIDAAIRNGIDPKNALDRAKSIVLTKHYADFFEALNKGRERKMEQAAAAVIRLGGTVERLENSVKTRMKAAGMEPTEEQYSAAREAFRNAAADVLQDRQ